MPDIATFITVRQLALRLGVTPRRARALAASGRIQGARKVGRDWLLPKAARIAPGSRGPQPRAVASTMRLMLTQDGHAWKLKRRRQQRFRKLAAGNRALADTAVVSRLPREAIRFEEPEFEIEELP